MPVRGVKWGGSRWHSDSVSFDREANTVQVMALWLEQMLQLNLSDGIEFAVSYVFNL
jgi:hypothetical protein